MLCAFCYGKNAGDMRDASDVHLLLRLQYQYQMRQHNSCWQPSVFDVEVVVLARMSVHN